MQRRIHRVLVSGLIFGSVAFAAFAALSESAESLLRRYPFDPACPWGRLANGKGTVVRCLGEKEVVTLAAAPAPAAPAALPLASPPSTPGAPAPAGSATPATSAAPIAVVPTTGRFEITVGPVTADKGELPLGKLGVPKDRYAKCIEDNGGIKGDTGEVHVRFLVRSKGIAEGVSVQKRFNVGPEAARCVAEVVNRRHVGVPEEPLVGATVVVKENRAHERALTPEELRALYTGRHAAAQADAEAFERLSERVSNLRGLAFAAAAGAGVSLGLGKYLETAVVVVAVGLLAFAGLVVWHGRVLARESEARRRALVNGDALLRVTGRFRELAQDGKRFSGLEHPYADDLDLFGPGSLFQRLSVAHTRFGEEALGRYLREPAKPVDIARRQTAVRALAPELDLRQRFEALSFGVRKEEHRSGTTRRSVPDPEPLFQWAKRTDGVATDPLLAWGARLLPPLTLLALFGWTRGVSPLYFVGGLALHAYLIARGSAACGRAFQACSATQGAFRSFGPMLSLVEGLSLDAPLLVELKARLGESERPPSVAMSELERILGWFELRHNGLVYPIVNLLTLWDVHCTLALEGWRKRTAPTLEDWFAVLGELEALSSLAGLAHDEPDFCFPEVSDELPPLEADGLGHPLIGALERKRNDVKLSAPGTALLVTGSNMSGKSTLLRALGLSSVLAFAGAPVCARRLRMMPLVIRTSIRVSDSLESGVSHFYAEVKKIKAVVEAANGGGHVLFLLDEILHGTNSRERQVGARWVLAELLSKGAVGAVSTHDEELCRLTPDLMPRVHMVHFRETVKDGAMTFDYTLREGPVQGGNALRVMRLAGLGVPLE